MTHLMVRARQYPWAVVVLVLALGYLGSKVFAHEQPVDFVFIWWAGKLWASGVSPYGPAFHTMDENVYAAAGNVRSQWFFYPPHWWPIARGSAVLPLESAYLAWKVGIALSILGGGALVVRAASATRRLSQAQLAGFVVFSCAGSATAITVSLGQTSGLVYLGVCCFCAAWLGYRRWLMVPALVLVSLKPNFGIAFFAFTLVAGGWMREVAAAGLGVLLFAAPALLTLGPLAVLREYSAVLGKFGQLTQNAPFSTTGLRNLVATATGADLPPTLLALLGAVLVVGAGLWWRSRAVVAPSGRARPGERVEEHVVEATRWMFTVLLCTVLLCVSSHEYDALLVAPLILVSASTPRWYTTGLALSCAAIFRANNVAAAVGLVDPRSGTAPGSFLLSLVFAWLAISTWVALSLRFSAHSPGRRSIDAPATP